MRINQPKQQPEDHSAGTVVLAFNSLEEAMEKVFELQMDREQEFLNTEMAKLMEPDIYLAVFGDVKLLPRVSAYLTEHKIKIHRYLDGSMELVKEGKIVATLPPIQFALAHVSCPDCQKEKDEGK